MEFNTAGPFQFTNSLSFKHQNNAKGHQWPKQELIKYAVYLKFSLNAKENGIEMDFNSWPFFRKLSIFIQSKNPNQCRIFHKRIMSDHSSIDSLICELKTTIHKFQEWEQHYESSLINLKNCLNREKEQVQKELKSKNAVTKQSIEFEPKVLQEEQSYHTFAKEDKALIPTGLEYQDQKQPKSSKLQEAKNKGRPSFSFCMDELSLPNEDLSLFNSTAKPAFLSFMNQKSGLEQRVQDCQSSFVNYMEKLSSLSNFMGSSLYDY